MEPELLGSGHCEWGAFPASHSLPWDFYGDFRWHVEMNDRAPGTVDHHRERIRFRVGAHYSLDEEVSAGVRLITGNPDYPNSSHQDLGRVFDSFTISLDRLFFRYAPKAIPGFTATGGKFNNPVFRNPLYAVQLLNFARKVGKNPLPNQVFLSAIVSWRHACRPTCPPTGLAGAPQY